MSESSDLRAEGEQVEVQVSVRVMVNDPKALCEYAKRRYAACWFDDEWEPADLAEAVKEALVVSNENPTPEDYGIELLDSQASVVEAG
jgi:hypothetical protein